MRRKLVWQIVAVVATIVAVLLIQNAVSGGMNAAFAGKDVNVTEYIVKIIGEVVLVCGAIYAGVRSKRD